MSSLSTICVHDDLTSCKTGVSVRSADDEFACRVYVKDIVTLEEGGSLSRESLDEHRKKDVLDIFTDLLLHGLVHTCLTELCASVCIAHVAE